MKKALAILLGVVLVLSMVSFVEATNIVPNGDSTDPQTANTEVIFKISQGYSVTIPDTIELDSADGNGYGDVKVDINTIPAGHYLNIVLDSNAGYYNASSKRWVLKLTGSTDSLEYLVGVSRSVNVHVPDTAVISPIRPHSNDDPDCNGILSISADQKNAHEVKVHCKIPDFDPKTVDGYAGQYMGQLTFVVSIDNDALAEGNGYVFEEGYVLDKDGSTKLSYTDGQVIP